MGKGSRNRELRSGDVTDISGNKQKLSKLQQIKKQEKKEKISRIVTAVAIIAVIVAIILSLVIVNVNKNTKLTRLVAGTSEKYRIDDSMVAYFMYSRYNTLVNTYNSYLSTIGLNTGASLKSQKPPVYGTMYFGYDSSKTWYENLLNEAVRTLDEYVAFAEEAQAKGVSLDKEDWDQIDSNVSSLKNAAKQNGMSVNSFLSTMFTPGVRFDSVKKCVELEQLALKYYNQLTGSYEFSTEEAQKYRDEHKSKFYTYDYVSYKFDASYETGADEETVKAAKDAAKASADELLEKATDLDTFKSLIVETVKSAETKDDGSSDTSGTDSGSTGETEETKEKTDEEILKDYIHSASYKDLEESDEDSFDKWAQDAERKAGDKKVFVDDKGNATVYMISEALHYDKTLTKNVRHILISATSSSTEEELSAAEKKANDILAQVNEAKDKEDFVDKFTELVIDNSAETGSLSNGGLYENVSEGDMVAEFNDWLFDESRKTGDTGVVKTQYGYHVMYFVGDGNEAWQLTAESNLKNDKFEEDLEALKKAHPITWNEENLLKID